MARRGIPKSGPAWFIKNWMDSLGIKQSDMIRLCDWSKASANQIYHGKQDYNPKIVADAAQALNAEPWELLMPYEQAMGLRRFRAAAKAVVSIDEPQRKESTG